MNFNQAFEALLGHEGGFSDNPRDPGGKTRYGVTEAVARANGYTGDMKDLPLDFAKQIYQKLYWAAIRADDLPEALKFDVFDAAVNSGPVQATKWLQLALGVDPDGVIGRVTLGAAKDKNPAQTLARFNGYRLRFMTQLKTWPVFGRGWAARIAKNLIGGGNGSSNT